MNVPTKVVRLGVDTVARLMLLVSHATRRVAGALEALADDLDDNLKPSPPSAPPPSAMAPENSVPPSYSPPAYQRPGEVLRTDG